MKRLNEVDILAEILQTRFNHVAVRQDYGWLHNSALCVLDCILSLNRRYDGFVYPRVSAFSKSHPEVINLIDLQSMFDKFPQVGDFCRSTLNYNHPQREQTLRGVVRYLRTVQGQFSGANEWERLQTWATSVDPSDYYKVDVRGFGLAGFQYMRMLFGVQTTKPDVHIIRFVSNTIGRRVNDAIALSLLEAAAEKVGLPLREVDGAIWEAGARQKRQA